MNPNWRRVSKENPCPVCEHDDWCLVSVNGGTCLCHRVESPKQLPSGAWVHVLKHIDREEWQKAQENRVPLVAAENPSPKRFAALETGKVQIRLSRYLMEELRIPADNFVLMDVRWDPAAKAVAFPMRDADGNVTGIRYRQLKTGKKWSLKGSKDGLFYTPGFVCCSDVDDMVVCEGPTDTLALQSVGISAVGRSCCTSGTEMIRDLIRRHRCRSVTIAADNDPPKDRGDGTVWNPGLDGARKLGANLGIPFRIVLPPAGFKDMRQWYAQGGLEQNDFRVRANAADWEGPGHA